MKDKGRRRPLCFWGTYERNFPRTLTLKEACRRLKRKVLECHVPFWEKKREKLEFLSPLSLLRTSVRLIFIYFRLSLRYFQTEDHTALVVGYNGYFDMPVAKFLSLIRKKPLIYTPVFPLYETMVEDREYVDRFSLKSKWIHRVDEICCRLADLIIIETQTYLNYYCQEFHVPRNKFVKIPLGADESNFYPRPKNSTITNSHLLKVLFYGKFIPLQGISYIIRAAKLLENEKGITFEIIGSGQLSGKISRLTESLNLQNAAFIPWVKYPDLPSHIQDADICLGIFGHTPKAQRGIPIKVYEALAMKRSVITGNSPAAREVFQNRVNAVLCEMANAQALADSISLLKNNPELRKNIAEEGYRLYQSVFSSRRLAENFKRVLDRDIK